MEKISKKRLPIWAWLLILAGVAAVLIAGRYIYVVFLDPASAFGSSEAQVPEVPSADPEKTTEPSEQPTPTPLPTLTPEEQLLSEADLEFLKDKVNILMLGWDESPERNDEDSELYRDEKNNFRSDVLMLLTVDFGEKTAKLISIPRDTMAKIYNTEGRWKINAAFAKGGSAKGNGFEYAMRTISDLLGGIPIEYYVGVNMSGLKDIVDAMGGVDYDVDVRIVLNGRVLEKGYQHLSGQQVLDYCRARKGISTDVGRNDRQQRMLFTIFEQLKDKDQLVNLPNIYRSMQDKFNTNLNFEQISAMTVFALDLDMKDLTRATLEGEYVTGTPYSHASFYVLDNEKLVSLVKEVFGITITPNEEYGLEYVLADKAAADAGQYLTAADWLLVDYLMPVLPDNVTPDGTYPSRYTDYPYRSDLERELAKGLVSARDSLIDAVTREGEEALDEKSIEKAQEELRDSLIYTASQLGLTQAHFQTAAQRKLLPEDVLSKLPIAPTPGPTDYFPGTTPDGGFGFPTPEPTPSEIFG